MTIDDFSAERIVEVGKRYREKAEFVIALGGGRVIDFGKALAHILNVPYVSIPTIASHDGIASPFVSFLLQLDLDSLGVGKVKRTPIAVIADTSIILEAPQRYIRAGIGELIGKLIAVKDWELAAKIKGEEFSEFAASLAMDSARIVLRNRRKLARINEESIRIIVKALIGCGVSMAIAGSSRPCSGSEHLFAHAVELLARERSFNPPLHGELVALGTIMMAYLHGLNWRRMKLILQSLGVPTTARELGLDRDLIVEALMMAPRIRPDRYTILGTGLSREAAENLVDTTEIA